MKPLLPLLSLVIASTTLASPIEITEIDGKTIAIWSGDTSQVAEDAPTDADIAGLAVHGAIEEIQLQGCTQLTGVGFAALKDLPKLEAIRLDGVAPTPDGELFDGKLEGYEALAELDQVLTLSLANMKISNEGGVKCLRGMKSLRHFHSGTMATDELIIAASLAPTIRTLRFGTGDTVPEAKVTMAGFSHYGFMTELESLSTGDQPPDDAVTRQLFDTLAQIENLRWLELNLGQLNEEGEAKADFAPVSADDLQPLSRAENLERVEVIHLIFDDTALQGWLQLPALDQLVLNQCLFSEDDLALLQETLPQLEILVYE